MVKENDVSIKKSKMNNFKNLSRSDKAYYICIYCLIAILLAVVIYPLYFIIIASISDVDAIFNGEVFLFPIGINFKGYERLFQNALIWIGYKNTIFYTAIGTTINVLLTITCGWALSRDNLPMKKFLMWFFIFTMFFSGGLIPFYMLVSQLGWVGNPIALILPSAVSVWNVFMTKAYYYSSIPRDILEAAEIDGAGHFISFFKIVLPLSSPIIAVMILFYAVGHWNSYFNALIFLNDENQYPLQLILRDILITTEMYSQGGGADADTILEQSKIANSIKYTSIIVSTLPILVLYPFISKYFEKGIMVGSFK